MEGRSGAMNDRIMIPVHVALCRPPGALQVNRLITFRGRLNHPGHTCFAVRTPLDALCFGRAPSPSPHISQSGCQTLPTSPHR